MHLPHLLPRHRRHLPVRRLLLEGRHPRPARGRRSGRPRLDDQVLRPTGTEHVAIGPLCRPAARGRLHRVLHVPRSTSWSSVAARQAPTRDRTQRTRTSSTAGTMSSRRRSSPRPPSSSGLARHRHASASSASPRRSREHSRAFGRVAHAGGRRWRTAEATAALESSLMGIATLVSLARHRARLRALRPTAPSPAGDRSRGPLAAPLQARRQQALDRRDLRLPHRPAVPPIALRPVEGRRRFVIDLLAGQRRRRFVVGLFGRAVR